MAESTYFWMGGRGKKWCPLEGKKGGGWLKTKRDGERLGMAKAYFQIHKIQPRWKGRKQKPNPQKEWVNMGLTWICLDSRGFLSILRTWKWESTKGVGHQGAVRRWMGEPAILLHYVLWALTCGCLSAISPSSAHLAPGLLFKDGRGHR